MGRYGKAKVLEQLDNGVMRMELMEEELGMAVNLCRFQHIRVSHIRVSHSRILLQTRTYIFAKVAQCSSCLVDGQLHDLADLRIGGCRQRFSHSDKRRH